MIYWDSTGSLSQLVLLCLFAAVVADSSRCCVNFCTVTGYRKPCVIKLRFYLRWNVSRVCLCLWLLRINVIIHCVIRGSDHFRVSSQWSWEKQRWLPRGRASHNDHHFCTKNNAHLYIINDCNVICQRSNQQANSLVNPGHIPAGWSAHAAQ